MVIQFRSFLIAAILCICVPMAPSLSGQEGPGPNGPRRGGPDRNGPNRNGPNRNGPNRNGPDRNGPDRNGPDRNGPGRNDQKGPQRKGPDQKGPQRNGPQRNGPQRNGPQRNGPQRNGGGPGFRGFGFPGADFRGSDMRRPMGPGFGRPDSKDAKSRGNTGGSQRPAPHRSGPKDFGPRYSKQSDGGGKDPRGDRGIPHFSSMNRGFMTGGMPRSNFGKRGSGNRSFGKRGMQHRGVSRGRFQGGKSRFSYARHGRSMQRFSGRPGLGSFHAMHKRGMQHRGMQHRGMQHRGMMSFGSQAFGKGPSRSAPKMPRMGNVPRGMNRHSTGRSSGFEGRGSDRFDSKPDRGRGIHSGANHSRGDDRVSDRVRGPAGMNRPVDHDQRMEQMKQFFGGQGGNRGPTGPDRGPRGKESSDNKSDRNNRSNMRPDFPQRGPGMDRSFGPPRITNRGGDSPASRGFDRRDIKPDRPNARASRSDARPSRDDDRAPERKPAERNRKVEVEINGDTGTITLKGSAEDVRRFQQLLDRANLKGKTEVKGKSEQTKGETSNSRRRPSRASDKKTSKEVAPSKTAPESELWNFV